MSALVGPVADVLVVINEFAESGEVTSPFHSGQPEFLLGLTADTAKSFVFLLWSIPMRQPD